MEMKHFPTINLEATGKRIAQLRTERGLSVRDLQDYFGFEAPQAIYKWQNGVSLPTVDNLLGLSMLLGVPMDSILIVTAGNDAPPASEPDGSFFLLFSFCSPVRQEPPVIPEAAQRIHRLPCMISSTYANTAFATCLL